jgi:hypothetical protein
MPLDPHRAFPRDVAEFCRRENLDERDVATALEVAFTDVAYELWAENEAFVQSLRARTEPPLCGRPRGSD